MLRLPLNTSDLELPIFVTPLPGLGVLVHANGGVAYVPGACIREAGYLDDEGAPEDEESPFVVTERTIVPGQAGAVRRVTIPRESTTP